MRTLRSSSRPTVNLNWIIFINLKVSIFTSSSFSYCDNLEEIVVSRACISFDEEIGKKPYDFPRRRKKLYPRLKSLIFLAVPTSDSFQEFPFYDVREDCELTTLWTNALRFNCPELKNCKMSSLSWKFSSKEVELHPGICVDNLESYWEPESFLMRSIKAPTKLKLVHCLFDPEVVDFNHIFITSHFINYFLLFLQNFQDFCLFSPLIEVLKLESHYKASPLVWNKESWKKLARLR